MAGFKNRRNRRRRPRKVKKTWALVKKNARSQASQIITLQRQITGIQRHLKDYSMWRQYTINDCTHLSGSTSDLTRTGVSYSVLNLVDPVNWTPIFQTPSNQESLSPNKFRGRSMGLEVQYSLNNPATATAPVTCTMFLCSLRREVAQQFVHATDHGAGMDKNIHYHISEMSNNTVPTTGQGDGMCFLNKGIFKIHRVKRFMVGGKTNMEDFPSNSLDEGTGITFPNTTAVTTSLNDNYKRYYMKHRYQNLLKSDGPDSRSITSSGGFRELTLDTLQPTDQLYLFTFANVYGDQQLKIAYSAIFTGKTTN